MNNTKTSKKRITGKWGEDFAEKLLISKGYSIQARNYRTTYGEIDIVAQKFDRLFFIEVKTRTNRAYGLPEESITTRKRAHMQASAEAFLQDHPEFGGEWQIDVIAIEIKPGNEAPEVAWFENAIS